MPPIAPPARDRFRPLIARSGMGDPDEQVSSKDRHRRSRSEIVEEDRIGTVLEFHLRLRTGG
jgi:hypothetical protein